MRMLNPLAYATVIFSTDPGSCAVFTWSTDLAEKSPCNWVTVGGVHLCINGQGAIQNDGPNKGKSMGDFLSSVRKQQKEQERADKSSGKGKSKDRKEGEDEDDQAGAEKMRDHPLAQALSYVVRGAAGLVKFLSNPVAEGVGMAMELGIRVATGKVDTHHKELTEKYGVTQANMIMASQDMMQAGLNAAALALTGPAGWLATGLVQVGARNKLGKTLLSVPGILLTHHINNMAGTMATTKGWRDGDSAHRQMLQVQQSLHSHGGSFGADPGVRSSGKYDHPSMGKVHTSGVTHSDRTSDGTLRMHGNVNGVPHTYSIRGAVSQRPDGMKDDEWQAHLDRHFHSMAHHHYNPGEAEGAAVYKDKDGGYVSHRGGQKPPAPQSPPKVDRGKVQVHGYSAWGGPVAVQGKYHGQNHDFQLSEEDSRIVRDLESQGKQDELDEHLHKSFEAAARAKVGFSMDESRQVRRLTLGESSQRSWTSLEASFKKEPASSIRKFPRLRHEEIHKIGVRVWKDVYKAYLKTLLENRGLMEKFLKELKKIKDKDIEDKK